MYMLCVCNVHMYTQTMEGCLKNVEGAVEEYKRQNDLINLQSQFMGYVCGAVRSCCRSMLVLNPSHVY